MISRTGAGLCGLVSVLLDPAASPAPVNFFNRNRKGQRTMKKFAIFAAALAVAFATFSAVAFPTAFIMSN